MSVKEGMTAIKFKRPWGIYNAGMIATFENEVLSKMPKGTYSVVERGSAEDAKKDKE